MDETLAIHIISQWHADESRDSMIFGGDRKEVEQYLQAVAEIQCSDDYSVIQMAMSRLEHEFCNILLSHTNPLHSLKTQDEEEQQKQEQQPQSSCSCLGHFPFHTPPKHAHHNDKPIVFHRDAFSLTGLVPNDAINDLRGIAERMISCGCMCQCIEAYASVRKSLIDATFERLGIDDVSWGQLDLVTKIKRWTLACVVCVGNLFAAEKKLCEEIFEGVESFIAEACFMETVKAPAMQLLKLAEATSITLTSSPDNLFKILDLYRTLDYLMPEIHLVFVSESIHVMAAEVLSRLAKAARMALSKFDLEVLLDKSKVVVISIPIHPFTTYVMDYLSLVPDYKQILNTLLVPKPSLTLADLEELLVGEEKSLLDMHLIWIIEMLQIKLDEKKIRQAATSYERATWARVLYCLREEGLYAKNGGSVSKSVFKERIKAFNGMFEKVLRTQAVWLVPDSQLRKDLLISILQKLIPAYESFVRRYDSHILSGSGIVDSVKYSVEDLKDAVLNCFKGTPNSQHLRRRSQRW
ncbi:hypothetical protein RJT34_17043 [Clitoria ternatea]|uniref:Exocyst subunit Exo70 family protein n=1 Tax=Clitoria ternatea TaxID=43366 RepID=A0AAN9J884_CLITE